MIKNVLFPIDFSPSCIATMPFVKSTAALLDARVTLLHVCDLTSSNGFELYVRAPREIAQERWSIARCKIDSFLESEFPLASCPRVLHCGNAAEQIVAAAVGFDLIIMPTHAGRFRRMLLGSTTAKVLNNVHCPVLSAEHIQVVAPRPLGYRQWVCALAFNADSARVLNLANHAAAEVGAKLLLVHVVESNSGKVNCAAEWAATQRSKLFVDRSKRHFSTWLGKHRRTCSSLAGLCVIPPAVCAISPTVLFATHPARCSAFDGRPLCFCSNAGTYRMLSGTARWAQMPKFGHVLVHWHKS